MRLRSNRPITFPSSIPRRIASRIRGAPRRIRYLTAGRSARELVVRLRSEGLTYLEPHALLDLRNRVREIERHGVPGELIEAGTAGGGSAILIAAAKTPERPLRLFDTFGMIPPPSPRDGTEVQRRYEVITSGMATGPEGTAYYGYEPDLLGKVRASFEEHGIAPEENNVRFIRGLYEETLHVDGPVAFAHLDCDWYDSVRVCLERIEPMLAPGGVLVIDDYDAWSGCREAVDEYFADKRDGFSFRRRSRLHVVKHPDT